MFMFSLMVESMYPKQYPSNLHEEKSSVEFTKEPSRIWRGLPVISGNHVSTNSTPQTWWRTQDSNLDCKLLVLVHVDRKQYPISREIDCGALPFC